mgnify:CR=1 FL=1
MCVIGFRKPDLKYSTGSHLFFYTDGAVQRLPLPFYSVGGTLPNGLLRLSLLVFIYSPAVKLI